MNRFLPMAFGALLFFAVSVVHADEAVAIKVGYINMSATGLLAGNVGGTGTQIDVERDLRLDNSQNVIAEAALQFGDSRLSVGYLPLDFSGTGVITLNGTFNGQPISISDSVNSSLKAEIYDISYTYFVINMDDLPSRFQLGIEVAVKLTNAEASLTNLTVGYTETTSATVPIPTIGARLRVGLADFISINGRVGYLGYAGNRFLDADGQIEFSPIPTLGIYGGYRYLELKVDEAGIFVDTRLSGPYAGAFFRF